MDKDNDYYRTLDLRRLAKSIPADKEARGRSVAFQEMLIALVLRCPTESFTGSDLRTLLGEPDSIEATENAAVWEYSWQGEHCARPYRSSTPFVVQNDRVVGIRGKAPMAAF
jgi:hypothetical protein